MAADRKQRHSSLNCYLYLRLAGPSERVAIIALKLKARLSIYLCASVCSIRNSMKNYRQDGGVTSRDNPYESADFT